MTSVPVALDSISQKILMILTAQTENHMAREKMSAAIESLTEWDSAFSEEFITSLEAFIKSS